MSTHNPQRTPEEIQQDLQDKLGQALRRTSNPTASHAPINLKRYRKVRWFFFKILLHIIWWDIFLNRPILEYFRQPLIPRWQAIAGRYRLLALEMGGVLIKLGQFLSTRVDILPIEVTRELAGLQDAVPPVAIDEVITQIEADFGRPVASVFTWFDPQPLGSASLSQAHLATLATGEKVVVKILRPGIDVLVETDLAAITLALRWLKLYRHVSKRVNLDWLAEEFTNVTRNELDFVNEGHNAERFAKDFANDPQVEVPKVYWDYSAKRTLTLENVGYIKIGDLAAIEAAGISRAAVAKKFYSIYMTQCFVTNFVHSDPHPGNVFIRPLRHPDEPADTVFKPGDIAPYKANRPFQVVFVDFGMMATIPERLRVATREYAIALGTRDAYRMIQAYIKSGSLLPGADLKRLEEAHQAMFERFWGVRMGRLNDVALAEAEHFVTEYRDLIQDAPFQFQADMLFVVRAIGILSGMATNLDPEFDPWTETIPFAERLAQEEIQQNWRGWAGEALRWGQLLIKLPEQMERVLNLAQRGNLTIQTALAPDTRKMMIRLEQSIQQLTWVVLAVGLLIAGILAEGRLWYSDGLIGLAILSFLWGMWRGRP